MIKGCYITNVNVKDKDIAESGIGKKILQQCATFEKNGFHVDINIQKSVRIMNNIITLLYIRLPLTPYDIPWKYTKELMQYDFLYIRKGNIDFSFYRFIKKLKKNSPSTKVILELPTYPYNQEWNSVVSMHKYIKDFVWRKKLKAYIDRIVTFSNDNKLWGIDCIHTSNGIDCEKMKPILRTELNDSINLIAVANLSFWHGYDRLIEGMHLYYSDTKYDRKENIVFHIVGTGNELIRLKNLVEKYQLCTHVVFYNTKKDKELDMIYAKADIGIDALGRHRTGVYYNSTLKGKEYLAKGLPVISGVMTELDEQKDFKYYLRVSADDRPVNMDEVIEFYHKIYAGKIIDEINDISQYIHTFCAKNFDHSVVWSKVIEYIRQENFEN